MAKGYRQGRLGEEIKKIISQMLLRELKDPRLEGMISITDVDVTGDNSYATCYITILDLVGAEEQKVQKENDVLDGLSSAEGKIRHRIGKEIKLRHVPELIFKIDRSMEYGRHMDEVLKGLNIHDDEEE